MPINAISFLGITSKPTLNAFSARSVARNNNNDSKQGMFADVPAYNSPVVKNDILANKLDLLA